MFLTSRYKRCDQIEERKARRLSGRTAPKGTFSLPFLSYMFCNTVLVLKSATCHLLLLGSSKRRRSSFSCGHSSDEGIEGAADSPSCLQGDGSSPSVRKQPKRVVKPRVYFDLVDYESDLDEKAFSSSASPARRRGHGPRFSPGKVTLVTRLDLWFIHLTEEEPLVSCLTPQTCYISFLQHTFVIDTLYTLHHKQ